MANECCVCVRLLFFVGWCISKIHSSIVAPSAIANCFASSGSHALEGTVRSSFRVLCMAPYFTTAYCLSPAKRSNF